MSDKRTIGALIGVGAALAGGIGVTAAVAHGRRKQQGPLVTGFIPGYVTYPGEFYDTFIQVDDDMFQHVGRFTGIWFGEPWDYFKYLYDNLREFGLPVRGCYVAVGHSRKAGVHALDRKVPMRGFNNWGVKAGWNWRRDGKPFWIADTVEYIRKTGIRKDIKGAKWRFYYTIQDAVDNWLAIMRGMYPISYDELFSKNPDPYRYHEGLEHGKGGAKYATGAFNMGDLIAQSMVQVPNMLNKYFGYNLPIG